MKIGVSAKSGSMEAEVESRFGRCAFFVIVDSESMRFEAFSNPATSMSGGAGPQTVQEFVNRGAEVILTGHVGPKAEDALSAANLEVVTGVSGKVREAVEAFLAEKS
jgi:predicted Fe-Mo cluster-binding NifX family protein